VDGVSYAHFLGDAAGRGVRYLRYRDIAGGSILSSFSMHAARRSLPQTARAIALLSWTPLGAACALELSRHTLVLN